MLQVALESKALFAHMQVRNSFFYNQEFAADNNFGGLLCKKLGFFCQLPFEPTRTEIGASGFDSHGWDYHYTLGLTPAVGGGDDQNAFGSLIRPSRRCRHGLLRVKDNGEGGSCLWNRGRETVGGNQVITREKQCTFDFSSTQAHDRCTPSELFQMLLRHLPRCLRVPELAFYFAKLIHSLAARQGLTEFEIQQRPHASGAKLTNLVQTAQSVRAMRQPTNSQTDLCIQLRCQTEVQ
jgi:hypothetical protein